MTTHSSALAAKVAAVNQAHTLAKQWYPILVEYFKGFYDQKVIKTDGSFLASVTKNLPKLPSFSDDQRGFSIFRNSESNYSISFTVKVRQNYFYQYANEKRESCIYHEVNLYVADLAGQICKPVTGGNWVLNTRADWTEKEVAKLRETFQEAQEKASQAESALGVFGCYDR